MVRGGLFNSPSALITQLAKKVGSNLQNTGEAEELEGGKYYWKLPGRLIWQ
jgi:hypothetical protein